MTEEEPTASMLPAPPRLDSARHPFEQFVLFLGTVAGLPLLFGAPEPGSTSALLGPIMVHLWAWLLAGGCAVAFIGSWWDRTARLDRFIRRWRPRATSALLIEQTGLVALGGSCVVYVYGIVVSPAGVGGRLISVALVFGLGLAAIWRARQIRRWVAFTVAAQEIANGSG